jgi:hypothetical protein
MRTTLFALFDDPRQVAGALADLEAGGTASEHCTIVAHRSALDALPSSELDDSETSAARTGARVAALGGLTGAVLGALAVGPLGLIAAGPLAAVLFTSTAGTLVGAFAGLVAGATDADPALKQLAEGLEAGKVLLTVQAPTAAAAERAEAILREHHARVVRHHLLRGLTPAEQRELARA